MTSSPSTPRRLRSVVISLLVAAGLGGGGWGGYRWYRVHRVEVNLTQAEAALNRGDLQSAQIWVLRVLQEHPEEVRAARLAARIEDRLGLPDAPVFWARVVQLEPGNPTNYLDWAKAALQVGNLDAAARALEAMPVEGKGSGSFHELKAGLALALRRPEEAERHFAEAVRVEPMEVAHQVNLASLRLSRNDGAAQAARTELETVHAVADKTRLLAIRALLGDAVKRSDAARSGALRSQMQALPDRTWNDELLCLEALLGQAEFHPELARLQGMSRVDPIRVVALADWLTGHGQAAETKHWLDRLPELVASNARVQISLANALTVLADWRALRAFLEGKDWRAVDFLRRALEVRCGRELGEPHEVPWNRLTTSVDDQPEALLMLAGLAQGWGWGEEVESLYWRVASKPCSTRRAALRQLWAIHAARKDTAGLHRVAQKQWEDAPDDAFAANNFAFLSLLLKRNEGEALRLATRVGTAPGAEPEFVATHAFALCRAKRAPEAVAALQSIPEEVRKRPGIALYLALALKTTGEDHAAAKSAAAAGREGFLPEEKALLDSL